MAKIYIALAYSEDIADKDALCRYVEYVRTHIQRYLGSTHEFEIAPLFFLSFSVFHKIEITPPEDMHYTVDGVQYSRVDDVLYALLFLYADWELAEEYGQ